MLTSSIVNVFLVFSCQEPKYRNAVFILYIFLIQIGLLCLYVVLLKNEENFEGIKVMIEE
jgi:hypothetical protein